VASMVSSSAFLSLLAFLCVEGVGATLVAQQGISVLVATPSSRAAILGLRGGADDDALDDIGELDEELDGDEEGGVVGAGVETPLENPFLGAGGSPLEGGGLHDLAQSLQDPKLMQEALREMQDPETLQRIRAMMEDPEFLNSMKQYVEQITKDPQFEQLKAQTEKLMQEPGFVEEMSKALMSGDMGNTLAEMGASLGGMKGDGEED